MYYARLKPHNHKQGYTLYRYHFAGNLFQGGDRPTWYRVDDQLANVLQTDAQESGRPSFDVVTVEEKLVIDKIEEERRMVAMGMMSATMNVPAGPKPVDLLSVPPSSRATAIPQSRRADTSEGGDLSASEFRNPPTE